MMYTHSSSNEMHRCTLLNVDFLLNKQSILLFEAYFPTACFIFERQAVSNRSMETARSVCSCGSRLGPPFFGSRIFNAFLSESSPRQCGLKRQGQLEFPRPQRSLCSLTRLHASSGPSYRIPPAMDLSSKITTDVLDAPKSAEEEAKRLEEAPQADLEDEIAASISTVAESLGLEDDAVRQSFEMIQLLLPDWLPTVSRMKAATGQWYEVRDKIAAVGPGSNNMPELLIMSAIKNAINAGENDMDCSFSHNYIIVAVTNLFAAIRCSIAPPKVTFRPPREGQGLLNSSNPGRPKCSPSASPNQTFNAEEEAAKQSVVRQVDAYIQQRNERISFLLQQPLREACRSADVTNKLILLRSLFPSANVSRLIVMYPIVLRMDSGVLNSNALAALELLKELEGVDQLIERAAFLLDLEVLQAVLAEMESLFPEQRPAYMLQQHVKVSTSVVLMPYIQQSMANMQRY